GAVACMSMALKDAGISPEDVQYINAHGTSTQANDVTESNAILKVFGGSSKNLFVSSTKSMTGHLLGAAGGIEALFTVCALDEQIVPPTINLDNVDPECAPLNYVPNNAVEAELNIAISNSFGFGGTNATIALKRFEG
ncbi:MAG: beta-ketoacyl-[acyl-carrier-protein] synthase II, partial [Phototrophicales bacterium]